VVFWKDFVAWRTVHHGLLSIEEAQLRNGIKPGHSDVTKLPGRAAQILAEAG